MGKLTVMLAVLSVVCLAMAAETTTEVEKPEEATTVIPTRFPPQPSTPMPDLVHAVKNETVQNVTAEAEKNTQKNASARLYNYSGLVLAVLGLCAAL